MLSEMELQGMMELRRGGDDGYRASSVTAGRSLG